MDSEKEIDIKNRSYCFFNGMINTKNLGPDKIKTDQKSYKNILVYHIRYVTFKNLSYARINSVNSL